MSFEMGLVDHETGRDVRHDAVAVPAEAFRQPERRIEALARRCSDGHRDLVRHPFDDRILDGIGRNDLEPGIRQQRPGGLQSTAHARPSSSAGGRVHKPLELELERPHADLEDRERKPEHVRDVACLGFQRGRAALRQPDDPAVMTEVVGPELGMTIEAELAQHGPAEAPHEEIGQHVRAGLGGEELFHPLRPGEHVVAVKTPQTPDPEALAHAVEDAIGPTVGVGDDDVTSPRLQTAGEALDGGRDLLRDGCAAEPAGGAAPLARPVEPQSGGSTAPEARRRRSRPRRLGGRRYLRPGRRADRRTGR